MITVVSMSPAIDRKLEFDHFSLCKTNRVRSAQTEAAGKGIAVSVAAKAMGLPVQCVGVLPGMDPLFTERLQRHDIPFDFLQAPGTVRTNLKLFDQATRQITEINEPCPALPAHLQKKAAEKIVDYAKKSEYLVLTGSLPEGVGFDWYAEIIRQARRSAPECRCVLDADGERLRLGVLSKPWMIKPNLEEMEQLTGERFLENGRLSLDKLLSTARTIQKQGASNVVISLGAMGAMAVSEKAYFTPALKVPVVTTTNAGDAMVAGFLYGFLKENTAENALRFAAAAAASRCCYQGDAFIDFETMKAVSGEIAPTRFH